MVSSENCMDGAGHNNPVQYLPEECIARIISFTSILDAAGNMSMVSKMFKSAADSDIVWERFLPSDIGETLSELFPSSLAFSSKKELYFRLRQDPVLIDEGKNILGLEKHTGKKCYMIAPRELRISWGEDRHYWRWRSLQGSRFSEAAQLRGVWWFDILGKTDTKLLSPKTTTYLVFNLDKTRSCGFGGPVKVSVLSQTGLSKSREIYTMGTKKRENSNQWKEIKIGEFYNEEGDDGWVEMRLWKVDPSFKTAFFAEGIDVRPKDPDTSCA